MTWSRFDDAARKHPKSALAGNEAWGFWAASVMWSNEFGTDGFIPDSALGTVPPVPISARRAKQLAQKLCEARIAPDRPGLFERDDARGGYVIHDFLEWNPSKAQTDERRKRDRLRKDSARTASGRRADSERTDDGLREDSLRSTRAQDASGWAGIGSGSPEGVQGEPSPASATTADPSALPAVADTERELPCPEWLAERFPAYPAMAEALGVSEAQLRAAASEFVSYWTIGAGAGSSRRHWARKLREHLRRGAEQGRLPAPAPTEATRAPAFVPMTEDEIRASVEAANRRADETRRRRIARGEIPPDDPNPVPTPKDASRPPRHASTGMTAGDAAAALVARMGVQ